MRWSAVRHVRLLAGLALVCSTGCQTVGLRFLNLIGLEKKPLSLVLVLENRPSEAAQVLNPFKPYGPLQKAMAAKLGRPVSVDPCFDFQLQSGLDSGWHDLAIVTPAQYARLKDTSRYKVLAVPLDERGRAARCAVLVVPATSKINAVEELRGKVVAFGPHDDARTHHAAVQLLAQAGLKKTDLSLEVLPIPGSLKHMPHARAIAQTVMSGSAHAGFIDEAAWEAFPEHAEKEGDPAREELREIGRTVALPTRLVIASPSLKPAAAAEVERFLVAVGKTEPEVLEALRVSGYRVPDADLISSCGKLMASESSGKPRKQPDNGENSG